MKIIGISGIETSVPFKRRHWPGLEEREYRMSQGHDAAAALIVDGKIVAAAAEERFDLKKHSAKFPIGAIALLSRSGGTADRRHRRDRARFRLHEVREAVLRGPDRRRTVSDGVLARRAARAASTRTFPSFPPERVVQVSHHLAHAASAYLTSGWDDCLVLVIDGMGEAHSASVYRGTGGRLEPIQQISAHDSIGILYSLVTLHLGFDFNSDEYKIMGLAPYGDRERFRAFFDKAVELRDDGTIRIPILRLNTTPRTPGELHDDPCRTWASTSSASGGPTKSRSRRSTATSPRPSRPAWIARCCTSPRALRGRPGCAVSRWPEASR